jgi:hypothetical protein
MMMFASNLENNYITIKKNTRVTMRLNLNLVVPPDVDPKNVVFTLFDNFQLDYYSKMVVDNVSSNVNGIKFRFFKLTNMNEKTQIKIKNFNIDLDKDAELLPDINTTMAASAKIKIYTSNLTVFNSLKKVRDANPKVKIYLKY